MKKKNRGGKRNPERGFTLVELLASVVIFSVGILLILESIERSFDATGRIEKYTRAGLLLQEKLDEVQSGENLEMGRESGKCAADESFTWEREVRETSKSNLYEVTVRIKWDERKNVSAVTYGRQNE